MNADISPRSEIGPRIPPGRRVLLVLLGAIALVSGSLAGGAGRAEEFARIPIAYLNQVVERPPKLSNLDPPPEDQGYAGGRRDGDGRFAEALRRAAKRFGTKIVEERHWDYGPDARRTAQAEVPALTQVGEYDVLIVADEIGEFGEYLEYRGWLPRPVAGSQGLTPTSWHRTLEQWGAASCKAVFSRPTGAG